MGNQDIHSCRQQQWIFICSGSLLWEADDGYIPELGATGSVVVRLLDSLLGNNHIVFMDRFYNSPLLFKYLSDRNTYACGTAMPNRKYFPRELLSTKKI